jgi:hypothetical protein
MASPPRTVSMLATAPMSGGPARSPEYPHMDTRAMADPGTTPGVRDAAESTVGKMVDSPAPIMPKPSTTAHDRGTTIATAAPRHANEPPSRARRTDGDAR